MEQLEPQQLEAIINAALDHCELTRGLVIRVTKTTVVFDDGNNWMSYIEPRPECRQSYQPSPEAKKMLQKLLGDMRLKYNLR
jgi:hypothetical protein